MACVSVVGNKVTITWDNGTREEFTQESLRQQRLKLMRARLVAKKTASALVSLDYDGQFSSLDQLLRQVINDDQVEDKEDWPELMKS